MKKKFKNEIGITLVALIITIIILLILAGVSIATLTESGLFEKARQAEHKSENAQIKEETTISDYENKIGEYINSNRDVSKEEYNLLLQKVQDLENKSAITAYSTETINVTADTQRINLTETISLKGNKLILEDGGVKIGSGINSVLVSTNCTVSVTVANAAGGLQIYLNEQKKYATFTRVYTVTNDTINASTVLLNVKEGDHIYLYAHNTSSGATFTGAYLTVVEY